MIELPINEIIDMYQDGMNAAQISRLFKCSENSILRRLKLAGVEIRHTTKVLSINDICDMYNSDKSLQEIANLLKIHSLTIKKGLLNNKNKLTEDALNKLLFTKPKGISEKTSFNLFSRTIDGVNTRIRLHHTSLTDHIGIYTTFAKAPDIKDTMATNRNCSSFLGCHVAERVLSHLYNTIEIMPYGHPDYDFICGRGYKVDCKSSCLRKDGYWAFHIKKNIHTDYFLCLAFDNRDDLNPIHCWLIPGDKINHLSGFNISNTTLHKWLDYEQPLDKILSCCDVIKDCDEI